MCEKDEHVSIIQAGLNLLGHRFSIIVLMVKILKEMFCLNCYIILKQYVECIILVILGIF